MRPKHQVLLLTQNEIELSTLRMLLDVRGFRVLATDSIEQACGWLQDTSIDLHALVTDLPYGQAYENLIGMRPDMRVVWMGAGESKVSEILRMAVDFIVPRQRDHTHLIDTIKQACARRRGPLQYIPLPKWFREQNSDKGEAA